VGFRDFLDNVFTDLRGVASVILGILATVASMGLKMLLRFQYFFTAVGWDENLGLPFPFVRVDKRPGFRFPFGYYWRMTPVHWAFFALDVFVWSVIIYSVLTVAHYARELRGR
jgi:hypothetical protein